ncbi:hypothetical protein MLD38_016059 [Melastoma candidum]|uniref:Uncharacterized protein n=1 Tax=Melastoma candidum TaxID=119954 RepID=A0ACB9RHG0_9MYRT|nr:hypothetical protein MLD38_016059 [Melastoma candidum]
MKSLSARNNEFGGSRKRFRTRPSRYDDVFLPGIGQVWGEDFLVWWVGAEGETFCVVNGGFRLSPSDERTDEPAVPVRSDPTALDIPRMAARVDIERFLSGCEFDSSSIQFSFRTGRLPICSQNGDREIPISDPCHEYLFKKRTGASAGIIGSLREFSI